MLVGYKEKIWVCTGHDKRKSTSFGTYEELLNWTKEQIEEESKIKIGDDVKIIDEGKMYTSLGTDFFTKVYWSVDESIDEEKMFDIIRYYRYDYTKVYNNIKGTVLAEYDNKYIVKIKAIVNPWYDSEYIVIGKEGVKKVNA